MIGGLYYRIRDPDQIKKMSFTEMKYWDGWNKAIDQGIKNAMDGKK